MIPLFERYPRSRKKIPYVSLADLPTPIEKLDRLGSKVGVGELYIKRDDLTGKVYGGNKVRKLEFLLGRAVKDGAKEVLTFGGAGSNHALATAIYAQQLGLRSISMLRAQPNSHHLRENLLMSYHANAELHLRPTRNALKFAALHQLLRHMLRTGSYPQVIPLGGSSPLGVTSYINAGLELRKQVEEGEMPEPDYIYVAVGTMGTAVGLTLGLMAAGLKSEIVPVRVSDAAIANKVKFVNLFQGTNSFLHSKDPSFPVFDFSEGDVNLREDFFGVQYALFTEGGQEALMLVAEEGFKLEGTYTGKAFAALIHDARKGDLTDRVVLFWNTANSRDFSDVIKDIDYRELPKGFYRYFEEDVQPLDLNP